CPLAPVAGPGRDGPDRLAASLCPDVPARASPPQTAPRIAFPPVPVRRAVQGWPRIARQVSTRRGPSVRVADPIHTRPARGGGVGRRNPPSASCATPPGRTAGPLRPGAAWL